MLRIELDGAAIVNTQVSRVSLTPLDSIIGPTEFSTGTPAAVTKIVDLSASPSGQGQVAFFNKAAFSLFWCYGLPSGVAPALTTANGIEIPSGGFVTLDLIGGLCVWYTTGTAMTAGQGLRVTGGYDA